MSSLQRYRRPGGFVQLVSLIESFPPPKRDKFLEMIEGESATWATALRDRMITLERLAKWNEDVTLTILKSLPLKTQAYLLEGLEPAFRDRLRTYLSASEKRRLEDILAENTAKPEEIQSTLIKFVETARRMISEHEISAEKVDPGLIVAGDIEATLDEVNGGSEPSVAPKADLKLLQRQVKTLATENKDLKDEVRHLRDRLAQIKKLA